jgi:hypothetical protein
MFPRFVILLQPFDKPSNVGEVKLTLESRAFLLQARERFWDTDGIRSEVEKVPRNQNELVVLLEIIRGRKIVASRLRIGTCRYRSLSCKPLVGIVLLTGELFINSHCVNDFSVASALSEIRTSRAYNPVPWLGQLNNIPPIAETIAKLTSAKRAYSEIRVGCMPSVMLNDI